MNNGHSNSGNNRNFGASGDFLADQAGRESEIYAESGKTEDRKGVDHRCGDDLSCHYRRDRLDLWVRQFDTGGNRMKEDI